MYHNLIIAMIKRVTFDLFVFFWLQVILVIQFETKNILIKYKR